MKEFFTEYPPVIKHPHLSSNHHEAKPVDWQAADDCLQVDRTIDEVSWAIPGKLFIFNDNHSMQTTRRRRIIIIIFLIFSSRLYWWNSTIRNICK